MTKRQILERFQLKKKNQPKSPCKGHYRKKRFHHVKLVVKRIHNLSMTLIIFYYSIKINVLLKNPLVFHLYWKRVNIDNIIRNKRRENVSFYVVIRRANSQQIVSLIISTHNRPHRQIRLIQTTYEEKYETFLLFSSAIVSCPYYFMIVMHLFSHCFLFTINRSQLSSIII